MSSNLRPLVVVVLLAGCPAPVPAPPDLAEAGSYRLEAMSPVELGLTYSEVKPLRVRYVNDRDEAISDVLVRYAIFGDPKGSALATDRVATPDDGIVGVNVTAGAAEAQFRVVVSAPNAADLEFAVSVSKFSFFEVVVDVSYDGVDSGSVATVEAHIFDNRVCSSLRPDAALPRPLRFKSTPGPKASFEFLTLLGVDYAIVGRAVGAKGNLIGFGCVDLSLSRLGANPRVVVPVPLVAVAPRVAGAWSLAIQLPTAKQPSPVAVWHGLTRCPQSVSELFLDELIEKLGGDAAASAIAAKRGAVDASGCRPESVGGGPSLDRRLHEAMSYAGSPSSQLAAVVADLDMITRSVELTSTLTLAAVAEDRWLGTHQLGRATLRGSKASAVVDLQASSYPIVSSTGLPVSWSGTALIVGEHGFTLRLPAMWGKALAEVALVPRGLPADARSLWPAIAAAVKRTVGGQAVTGCAAIEDLLCQQIVATPCALQKACADAVDHLGVQLRGPFIEPSGIDLLLAGSATPVDKDYDLQADSLVGGAFMAQVLLSSTSGDSLSVSAVWSGQRAR